MARAQQHKDHANVGNCSTGLAGSVINVVCDYQLSVASARTSVCVRVCAK